MHIVLTICSGLILAWNFFLLIRMHAIGDAVNDERKAIDRHVGAVREAAPRITTAEREIESLRRELRKLSGKFYAMRAELDDPLFEPLGDQETAEELSPAAAVCENWIAAQTLGPSSREAKCECAYCLTRRSERRALRAALVPKTVQGQAETAKLNAGKP